MIDLHTHSTASDGTFSPSELVKLASERGLSALSLTDHDTAAGIPEASAAAAECGILLVPGIEMSCAYRDEEIHLLGYFPDPASRSFQSGLSFFQQKRAERNERIRENFAGDGIFFSPEELSREASGGLVTRVHFARLLLRRGYVRSIREAFASYLRRGGRYVPEKTEAVPGAVMRFFAENDIWPSLAHPAQYGLSERSLERLLDELIPLGLRGLEVWHSAQSRERSEELLKLARRKRLLPTGGSDFHGANKADIRIGVGFGDLCIRDEVLDAIAEDRTQRFPHRS